MKTMTKTFVAALFLSAMSGAAWGQSSCETDPAQEFQHEFRSYQNGDWDNPFTWEEYHPETHTWCHPATHRPDYKYQSIKIQHYTTSSRSDTVWITTPVLADQILVEAGAQLVVRRGQRSNGRLTVTNDLIDDFDLVVWGDLTIDGGFTGGGFEVMPEAKAHIRIGGKLIILEGPLASNLVSSSSGINNLGDIFIEGSFRWEGGAVTGNPFRYGANGYLQLTNPAGSVIDDGSIFWPATNGPAHVSAEGPLTMNVPRTLPSFYTSSPVTNAHNLSFSGSVQIGCGGSFDAAPFYGENATLFYSGWKCSQNVGPEWSSGTAVGRGVPKNVRVGAFASDSSVVYMPGGPRGCPGTLEIRGKLVLNAAPGSDLSIGGNWGDSPWANYAGVLIPNSRAVVFDGTAEQMLFAPATFDALTIDNPFGVSVLGSIAGNVLKVNETLKFVNGNLRLYGYHSSLQWTSDLMLLGEVFGASSTRHIVTGPNGYGRVLRAIAGGGSFQFPIGPNESSYNPLTIALDPADSTEIFSVRVDSTINPETPDPSLCVQRTWDISEATLGGNHAALTFQWSGREEGANFTRNKSSTYHYTWGGYVEVASNGGVSGADPYIVSTTGGFPCTEFSYPYLSSYIVGRSGGLTTVEESKNGIPTVFRLSQNYPNPFNPSTTIRYALPKAGYVTLTVYNLIGKEMETLVSEKQPAGEHVIRWNPVGLPSGVYLFRIQAGEFTASRKLLLVK